MTPGARVAAAIEIVDDILSGTAAEKALTGWARGSRYAGSKDRAAVRDLVFDHLRTWRSDAVRGGGETARARLIGRIRAEGTDVDTLFHGEGHAPAPLSDEERSAGAMPTETGDLCNLQDWLLPEWQRSLETEAQTVAVDLQARAPVTLRVNTGMATIAQAVEVLLETGVETAPNPMSPNALTVLSNPRRVRQSVAYLDGWVELQDGSSQAAIDAVPEGEKVLDYCAGGGGKALGLAAQGRKLWAYDIAAQRMADIPARAERAQVTISVVTAEEIPKAGPFDVVFCDAPCSGSGAWRRSPEAKWTLTQDRLDELNTMQDNVLDESAAHVAEGGTLVYATCSVLACENEDRVSAFIVRNPSWTCQATKRMGVSAHGDGFFTAHLTRIAT